MIEPDSVDAAAGFNGDRFPSTIPRRIGARHQGRRRERSSPIVGSRLQQRRSLRAFRRPHDDDGGLATGAPDEGDLWRLFAVQPRVAVNVVDADRRAERAPSVAADRDKDVRRTARLRATPRDDDE